MGRTSKERTRGEWVNVQRGQTCPVCGKDSWCCISADGTAVYCMRVKSEMARGDGWIHKTGVETGERVATMPKVVKRPTIDWNREAKRYASARHAEHYRQELAQQLGVSVESLDSLWVGWGYDREPWWSFPERDAGGRVAGIVRRYKDGRKKMLRWGTHGLYYSALWATMPGPVYLPEGGSDTAALITLGVPAIGRPSCRGGVALLASMLGQRKDRMIVVVGENDLHKERRGQVEACPKNCGGCMICWPGLIGARDTARALSARINRKVRWAMPPLGTKDARDWLRQNPGASAVDWVEAVKGDRA